MPAATFRSLKIADKQQKKWENTLTLRLRFESFKQRTNELRAQMNLQFQSNIQFYRSE